MKTLIRLGLFLFFIILFSLLASCGGGGGSSDSDGTNSVSQSTGSVGILLTDKPAELSLFSAVNATIESIVLIGDDRQVPLFENLNATYDLLQLRNEALPLIFEDNVPVGNYCKIRLTLSDLELVMADDTSGDTTDNQRYYPQLTGNRKIDLLARDCFSVSAGQMITLQVDIDAGNSIHINSNNSGYNFRPVVFIDVLSDTFVPKLVRLAGEVTAIDAQGATLLLCDAAPTADGLGCVEVRVGENTAYFENRAGNGGAAQPLSALFGESLMGEMMTVVGWPRHDVQAYGEQKDADHPYMNIDALVLEHGDFTQVDGEVVVAADEQSFALDVAEDQTVSLPDPLTVQLIAAPIGGNGTRIVTKAGTLLTANDITVSSAVQVDGGVTLASALNAALVIVDGESAHTEKAGGTVVNVGADNFILAPDSATVCGSPVDNITVAYSGTTSILTVSVTDTGSLVEHGGTLAAAQTVNVVGYCENDGFNAAAIVIIDDQTTDQ